MGESFGQGIENWSFVGSTGIIIPSASDPERSGSYSEYRVFSFTIHRSFCVKKYFSTRNLHGESYERYMGSFSRGSLHSDEPFRRRWPNIRSIL